MEPSKDHVTVGRWLDADLEVCAVYQFRAAQGDSTLQISDGLRTLYSKHQVVIGLCLFNHGRPPTLPFHLPFFYR